MIRKLSLGIIILLLLPTISAQQIGLTGPVESSPTLADIDNNTNNGMEIVVGANYDYMHALYSDGTEMLRWRIDRTGHIFMTGLSSPALADLDGDGTKEIVIGGQKGSSMGADNPGYAWAYYLDGTQMWRYSTGKTSIYSSPVVADIDGDGNYEVLIGSNNYKLYALHGNGGLYWSKSLGGSKISTAAVGDVNEDGSPEIIIASSDGIVHILKGDGTEITTMQTGGLYISSPALADLDGDGDLEIIIASKDGKIYAWHGDGTDLLGWPVQANSIWTSSPAVGDLDGDGDLEVVVVTDSNDVYAYHGDGALLEGFPLTHQEKLGFSSPALADLDGDGKLEIILGTSWSNFNDGATTNGGKVYAWHINGAIVDGFPKTTSHWIKSSPAVADIDGDGKNEIVIGSNDNSLYIWETGATSWNQGWPMFHYNERNTRMYDAPTVSISSPLNGAFRKWGAPISFSAIANDIDGTIASYKWSSTIDGVLGTSASFTTSLSLGEHVITLTVKDNDEKVAKTRVEITVVENIPPTATILSPDYGDTHKSTQPITFNASATDDDGTIDSYSWTSSIDGLISTNPSFTKSDLSIGTHIINFTVQDNYGATDSDYTVITINPLYAPEVAIEYPRSGAIFQQDAVIPFNGIASDSDGAIVSYKWDFNGDGTYSWSSTSTGYTPHSYSSLGTYYPRFMATDDDGLSNTANTTIRIVDESIGTKRLTVIANKPVTIDLRNETNTFLNLTMKEDVNIEVTLKASYNVSDINASEMEGSIWTSAYAVARNIKSAKKYIKISVSGDINGTSEKISSVVISMYYGDADLGGISEQSLKIYWHWPKQGKWLPLVGTADYTSKGGPKVFSVGQDTATKYIWANISHFSEYGLAGEEIIISEVGAGGGTGGGAGGGSPSPIGLISTEVAEMTSTTYSEILITLSAGGMINKDRFIEVLDTCAAPLLLIKKYPLPTDPVAAQFARTVTKVTGDVYALAAKASEDKRFQYGSLENKLIIARGDLGVDSMAAVAYAKAKNIPILLVKPNELPLVTEAAISKIMAIREREIIIVGGADAVSPAVEENLKALGDVKRIWGETRIETALALAEEAYPDKNMVRVIVITDYASPKIDAVLMSYVLDAPLLYVKSDTLSPLVGDYISQHKETLFGPTKVVLLGVAPKVASEIEAMLR